MEIKKQKSRRNCKKLETSIEAGASSWLNTLPTKNYGLCLDKKPLWDSLHIRYNIPLKCIPSFCVSRAPFKLEHALPCPKGVSMSIRHNEARDFTAELLSECCKQQVKLYYYQQLDKMKLVSMLQLSDSGLKDK